VHGIRTAAYSETSLIPAETFEIEHSVKLCSEVKIEADVLGIVFE